MRLSRKLFVVLGLTLAILIPLLLVRGVINDRQLYRAQVVRDIGRSYAGAQSFAGPVLVIPYTQTVSREERDAYGVPRRVSRQVQGRWTYFPSRLVVDGPIRPGTRKRGPHEVRVYEWQGRVRADFDVQVPAATATAAPRTIGRPWLAYGIADVRGMVGTPALQVDGRAVPLEEGLGLRDAGGVHARLQAPQAGQRLALRSRLDLTLAGTESLALVPLGRSNRIQLSSTWPHPRFGGSFLPRSHDIDARGFRAGWDIASVATRAQSQFLAGGVLPTVAGTPPSAGGEGEAALSGGIDAVGVSLVSPVNVYSQADRATKYGVLFVLLTFVGFFLFELVKQLPIHPVQYGLVGLALAVFFLLLVSLSEHIEFARAYLLASIACIGLIGFYLSAVLRSAARAAGFAAMLATLYAALYGLLVSEDNALVLGSGLLFVILAALMVVTRKVDWYALAGSRPPTPPLDAREPGRAAPVRDASPLPPQATP